MFSTSLIFLLLTSGLKAFHSVNLYTVLPFSVPSLLVSELFFTDLVHEEKKEEKVVAAELYYTTAKAFLVILMGTFDYQASAQCLNC